MQKERDEILNAQAEDIQALAPLIEAILSDEEICVVGSEPEGTERKRTLHEYQSADQWLKRRGFYRSERMKR